MTICRFGVFSLDLQRLQRQFIELVEAASGKPVILQSDPKFAGHHHKGKDDISSHAIAQVVNQFGNGHGLQLRSMPASESRALQIDPIGQTLDMIPQREFFQRGFLTENRHNVFRLVGRAEFTG